MNDLTNFISHVRNHGVARSNRFRVTIPLPKKVSDQTEEPDEEGIMSWVKTGVRLATIFTGGTVEGARGLQVMCSSVQLPGVNIDTSDVNQNGHSFKVATGTSKTEIDFNFLLTDDMLEKQTIDMWKEVIVDGKTKKVGYYNDYITDIQIDVLNSKDKVTYSVVLEEAYPVLFNPVELNKEEMDGYIKYQLMFVYKRTSNPTVDTTSNPLLELTPVSLVNDVMTGNLDDAAYKARNLHKQIKAGTLKTSLGMETYGMCSNVLNESSGVGAQDMEGIVGGLVSTVKGTPNLDSDDSNVIVDALQGIL
ncbi:hypothetical protein MYOV003v1_p0205 [Vibrio phage 207E48.1]|nr:hypothetical protein MYOV003v1_p0205 [Vibrio phage 207E48.1]